MSGLVVFLCVAIRMEREEQCRVRGEMIAAWAVREFLRTSGPHNSDVYVYVACQTNDTACNLSFLSSQLMFKQVILLKRF